MFEKCKSEFRQKLSSPKIRQWQSIYKIFLFELYSRKIVSVGLQLYIINIWLIHNTKESMLWNYKTFHFSPKMRQMMYPDCKTTLKVGSHLCLIYKHKKPINNKYLTMIIDSHNSGSVISEQMNRTSVPYHNSVAF